MNSADETYNRMKGELVGMIRDKMLRSRNEGLLNTWEQLVRDAASRAADYVTKTVRDETKIEELARSAKQGATYAAISRDINALTTVMAEDAKPIIEEASQQVTALVNKAMFEATQDAIRDLLNERVQKLLEEDQ